MLEESQAELMKQVQPRADEILLQKQRRQEKEKKKAKRDLRKSKPAIDSILEDEYKFLRNLLVDDKKISRFFKGTFNYCFYNFIYNMYTGWGTFKY